MDARPRRRVVDSRVVVVDARARSTSRVEE